MTLKKDHILLCVLFIFVLAGACYSAESKVVREFSEALRQRDAARMSSLIKKNRESIPGEVKAILDEAFKSNAAAEAKEAKFNLAERLASQYRNITGDDAPLAEQQKRVFESYLSAPVSPVAGDDGAYPIEIRKTGAGKGPFTPDNIVIKSGSLVRWVNNDSATHILSSVNGISSDRVVSPEMSPGEVWEHRFYRPGVYYYLSFIHKEKMYGKITVE